MNRFKTVFIEATTIDDCWHQLLWEIKHNGRTYHIDSGSYKGLERLALDYVAGFIHSPHERPLAPLMPESSALPPPTTDEEISSYFANYLMDTRLSRNEHYRYSSWIVGGNGLSEVRQMECVIRHLKENPGNEHCYIVIGQPDLILEYDKPYKQCPNCQRMFPGKYSTCPYHPNETLIAQEHLRGTTPCLRGLDFRIINGALFTHVIYRSWDLIAGWPTNIGGFTLLNEYMAAEVGCEPGPLAFSCKSLHVYSHSYNYLNARFGNR